MKLRNLWSSMSILTQDQKDVSNSVVGGSLALLGVVAMAAMPLAANAQRMSGYDSPYAGGGYSLPQRPAAAPAPAPQPTYQPQAPQPTPQPSYGVFQPYGPLAAGRVSVRVDNTFDQKRIFGYTLWVQDNGQNGNDQMLIEGPEGKEQVWLNCWQTEEWKSYGPNSEQFIHAVVSQWCGWNEG